MGLIEALILGLVQGLTEFLPISSTAHVRILPALLGWPDPGAAFTAVIQLGTLLAVLIFFRTDLWRAAKGWVLSFGDPEARATPEARMGWAIFFGTIPIVVFGLLFKNQIETSLRSLNVIAWALVGMGLLLLLAERIPNRRRGIETVRIRDGLLVGIWQALALIPGASRSGSTITGALLAGFDRSTAARFSFLLSVPAIAAAAVLSLKEHREVLMGPQLPAVLVANVAAFVSGYAAIAFLIRFLQTRSVLVFVVYRVLLGLVILILLAQGVLHPYEGAAITPVSRSGME